MRHYDVFNGDADGICALRQLRLAEPIDSHLVTGVKRDIELLARVPAGPGDQVTVLDISLERNRAALGRLLEAGAHVRWFDHHQAGEVPRHPHFEATIDLSPALCTSAIVDRHLGGRFRPWAVVGAFGDNLGETALALAAPLGLGAARLEALRDLGESLNYNAYGESEADVLVPPAELYRIASGHADPFALIAGEDVVRRLGAGRRADLERALATEARASWPAADAYVLPDAPWSRRVIGTYANRLATGDPRRAHAVLAPVAGGGYAVSVRVPRGAGPTAAQFCARHGSGGGRATAGGIDGLPPERLEAFLEALRDAWTAGAEELRR